MILSEPVVKNISSVFKYNYENNGKESIDAALSVLKILDFEYENSCLLYQGNSIKDYDSLPVSFNITPITLIPFDVDCVETALNSIGPIASSLSPLLDCIGWVMVKEGSDYKIKFIGGAQYEVWHEPGIAWDYDMDAEDKNWREGSDWPDGIDLSKDIPKSWTS